MQKHRLTIVMGISFCILTLINIQCSIISVRNGKNKFSRIPVTKTLIRRYFSEREDYQFLYYYLSDPVILSMGNNANRFEATDDHKGEMQQTDSDRIIFKAGIRGQYVRHDENYVKNLWGKFKKKKWKELFKKESRFHFVIHFEDPPLNLEFLENDKGTMDLLTHTNKRGQKVLYFDSKEYVCLQGDNSIIQIDARQLDKIRGIDYYVQPATFDEPKSTCTVCTIFIGMGALLLLALLIDNSEQ